MSGEESKERGICTYGRSFYGWVTVSDKGQVAIPTEARKDLGIKTGDKLLVLSRKDREGIMLIKASVMDTFFRNLQEG